MAVGKEFDPAQVSARVREYLRPSLPWNRRLWSVGSVLAIAELLECVDAVAASVLSEGALANLCSNLLQIAGKDPGLGDETQRGLLKRQLHEQRATLRPGSMSTHLVAEIHRDAAQGYFRRWAAALRDPTHTHSVERVSRSIATHMLDSGLSPEFAGDWWSTRTRSGSNTLELPAVLDDLQLLLETPEMSFEVLVGFVSLPREVPSELPAWRTPAAVSEWLARHGLSLHGVRCQGGTLRIVSARDPFTAVEKVRVWIEQLIARATVGGRSPVVPANVVWVGGQPTPFKLHVRSRGVEVHCLEREREVWPADERGPVDNAIELASLLDSAAAGAAVTSDWAAVESLMIADREGVDRVAAADRLAAIVACSFPRAELTTLGYEHRPDMPDALSIGLGGAESNRDRSELVLRHLTAGRTLALRHHKDRAAESRMKAILRDPFKALSDVHSHAARALRRLYRHRNLVMHGGRIHAVALEATLRTASPLVGAGLDRVAHARFTDATTAMELAARAERSLALLAGTHARSIAQLLESDVAHSR